VGPGVPGGDPVEPARQSRPVRGGVPGSSRLGLDVSLTELGALHLQLDAQLVAELLAGPLVAVRTRAQPVVEMEADEAARPDQSNESRGGGRRVRPTPDEE